MTSTPSPPPPPPLPPPWYTSTPPWVFGLAVLITTWLQYWIKSRWDARQAYLDRHPGDAADPAVAKTVDRIKRLMDREVELDEQGLRISVWYRYHKRGLHVAILVLVFRFILFLLQDVVLTLLLWLFMDLPWACYQLPYANTMKDAIEWYKHRFQRQTNTDDVEMPTITASQPPELGIDWGDQRRASRVFHGENENTA